MYTECRRCRSGRCKLQTSVRTAGDPEKTNYCENMNGDTRNETPSPHELFYYAAQHQILICIPCQYAIQPAAIAHHLKEIQHIYRRKRDPFIVFAKKLKLRNPDNVIPPAAKDFPVPHLPAEQGWHCTHSACTYMCVSTKRMKLH